MIIWYLHGVYYHLHFRLGAVLSPRSSTVVGAVALIDSCWFLCGSVLIVDC